jgi:two-component system, OmpR family, sensor histidine kinase VanS
VGRAPGLSVRLKLTLSYAGFLMLAGALMLAAVWVVILRYIPNGALYHMHPSWWFVVDRSDPLHGFGSIAAIVLACLLVFGLLGGWLLAGRMLAPLDRITDATRTAANGSLSHRIELEGRKDEFRELADAFDTMLARLEAHVAGQQRFAANASHELRTPLAITQTLLEVARNDPNRDDGGLVDRLHAVNTRAIELTEALLLLSRADRRAFTPEDVDLSLIAEEAAETLLPLAEKRGLTIEISGEMTPAVGSHALLLQLTTNLLQNAIVHNLPEGGAVWFTTSVHAGSAMLTVENTGEKLSPQLVATLAEPFLRGTNRIRTDHGGVGVGLGLAIVNSITRAHEGTLTLSPRAGGGLRVTVELPATPTASADQQHELPAHVPVLADAMGLRDLGEREGLRDREREAAVLDQLADLGEHVDRAAGVPAAEPHPMLLRAGEVGDRHDMLPAARELDELGKDTAPGDVQRDVDASGRERAHPLDEALAVGDGLGPQ